MLSNRHCKIIFNLNSVPLYATASSYLQDLENDNGNAYSFASKNLLLESEITCCESKESGIEEMLQSLFNQGETFEIQSNHVEEEFINISSEVKVSN